jgi:hypothetical protein
MHVNITSKIEHLIGKKKFFLCVFLYSSFRSYSNTRTVAPITSRTHRSPGSTIKTSDTVESVRHHRIQPIITGDTTDVYQQVYHDDSSTHGSRTLDSRFSRDKYDLSDEQNTDEDEDEQMQKTTNGLSSSSPTHLYRSSEPVNVDDNHVTEFQQPIDQGKSSLSRIESIREILLIMLVEMIVMFVRTSMPSNIGSVYL